MRSFEVIGDLVGLSVESEMSRTRYVTIPERERILK
jgi:hypothetical protein